MGLKNKINKLVNEAIPIENREEIVQSIIQRIAQDGNFDNKYESISDLIGQIHRLPFNGLQKNYTKLNQDLYIEIKEFDDVKSNIETLAKAYRREYSIFTYEDIIKDSVGNELNIFGSNSHGLANKSQPGLLLKTIMELYTFGPLIAFWEAEKFLTGANIQTFMDFSPDKRKNYTDPYFNFSMDLSNLVLVFIFTDIKKLPNIFKHTMMEMPYNAPSRTTPDIIPSAQIETVSLTQHFPGTSQSNIIKLPLNTKNLERIPNVILGFSIESLQEGNLNEDLYTESMLIFDLNSTESYPFEKKDFEEIDCIYRGRGSTVTIVKHTPTNRVAVIKKIQIQKTEHSLMQHKSPKNEIEMLKKVTRHENIVDLYGVHESSTHIMLCMEYMNASLRRVFMKIHESQKIFPELLLGGVSVKTLNALNFCYQEKLIHRDIKPDNILINWTGEIKLSDFGESRFMIDSQLSVMPIVRYVSCPLCQLTFMSVVRYANSPLCQLSVMPDVFMPVARSPI
uniref:mitogen-activated protein kinase kinase n=2 Tax=Acrobeloides nanus TaxID=290746 RepID=A0A914DJA1_9BILA